MGAQRRCHRLCGCNSACAAAPGHARRSYRSGTQGWPSTLTFLPKHPPGKPRGSHARRPRPADDSRLLGRAQLPPQPGPQPSHDHRELDRGGMTPATPDWLLELRNARGAGIDAIALFRGAEPSAVIEAIRDCEIRVLPVGATLLHSAKRTTPSTYCCPANWPRTSIARCYPPREFLFNRAKASGKCPRSTASQSRRLSSP